MSTRARWRENAASPIAATNRAEMVGGGIAGGVTRLGSTLSYLAVDGLGSVTEALDTNGTVTAQQLYAPYGAIRYQVGSMPTTKGYAGQRQDVSSGLDYDVARYYDASTEQFASADTASDAGNGLDRLAYVGGNPETRTDPSGHVRCDPEDTSNCGGGIITGGSGGGGSQGGGCYSDANCGSGGYDGGNNPSSSGQSANTIAHSASSGAPLTNPAEITQACMLAASHPGWCSRYFDYSSGTPIPLWGDGPAALYNLAANAADYYWFLVSVGEALGGTGMLYYIRQTGQWLLSIGGYFGISVGFPFGIVILAAGYGLLLTKGIPSGQQVFNFVNQFTGAGTFAGFLGASLVGNPTGGWAVQGEVNNGFELSISGSWSGEPHSVPTNCQGFPVNILPPLPPCGDA